MTTEAMFQMTQDFKIEKSNKADGGSVSPPGRGGRRIAPRIPGHIKVLVARSTPTFAQRIDLLRGVEEDGID